MLQVIKQLNSNRVIEPRSPIDQITHDIADISVKEIEISELEEQNSELRQEVAKLQAQDPRVQEINKLKEENNKLEEKITKLKEKARGVLPLEGAKHLLWDELSKDVQSFRPQLMIVEEHEKALVVALSKCKLAEEKLANRTQEVAHMLEYSAEDGVDGVQCSVLVLSFDGNLSEQL
jgi:FtsZ-binding cell division protein ZapB